MNQKLISRAMSELGKRSYVARKKKYGKNLMKNVRKGVKISVDK